ncbi:hypothetical protein FB451DRAFT_1438942 [Mycena latifolia]|nr:hypothetical protein FB451DRAFT_1438942 [Mycena latifolia]
MKRLGLPTLTKGSLKGRPTLPTRKWTTYPAIGCRGFSSTQNASVAMQASPHAAMPLCRIVVHQPLQFEDCFAGAELVGHSVDPNIMRLDKYVGASGRLSAETHPGILPGAHDAWENREKKLERADARSPGSRSSVPPGAGVLVPIYRALASHTTAARAAQGANSRPRGACGSGCGRAAREAEVERTRTREGGVEARAGAPRGQAGAHGQTRGQAGQAQGATPALRIAQVGDCMVMLMREGEVAWRREEMWRWMREGVVRARLVLFVEYFRRYHRVLVRVAAPGVRRGPFPFLRLLLFSLPLSRTRTRTRTARVRGGDALLAAHVFTLPVQARDILILASNRLGDNLWDSDVLEGGMAFASTSSPTATSSAGSYTSAGAAESGVEKGRGRGRGRAWRQWARREGVSGRERGAGKEEAEADAHGLLPGGRSRGC